MAMFRGGPRDGQLAEPEHAGAEEIQVVVTEVDADAEGNLVSTTQTHEYRPDSFGNFFYAGVAPNS